MIMVSPAAACPGGRRQPFGRDRHRRQVGGESLTVDLALAAAVQRVGDLGAQLGQIDVIDAVTDFRKITLEDDFDVPAR